MAFAIDKTKASQGKAWFNKLGCASCHQIDASGAPSVASIQGKALSALEPGSPQACFQETPGATAARYQLSATEREAVRSALAEQDLWEKPLEAGQKIRKTLIALNCVACHQRGEFGGPHEDRKQFFRTVGEVDMGDEGRLPPSLSGVGAKLKPAWLKSVINDGAAVRPYMATRMPVFGNDNLTGLAEAFIKVDASHAFGAHPENVSMNEAKYGRKLVGLGGMSCITCHNFGKFKSLGIPALDLTTLAGRLQKDWFVRYLKDPQSLRPGTRMPSFWPEGQSVNLEVFDGDTQRQIDAIWSYLSIADDTNPPNGLIQGQKEIIADGEAVLYRNFIEGAGARAIGVGYPEKANLAFDANHMRLAMVWQGPFIDGARHSNGRGVGFEPPLGHNRVSFPEGPPFAFSVDPHNTEWPKLAGKEAGYAFKGYWLDGKRRPKFHYQFLAMDVEDYSIAIPGELDAFFRRYLNFNSKAHYVNLWMRVAEGKSILEDADGSYVIDQKLRMRFESSGQEKPVIHEEEKGMELLLPVELSHGKFRLIQEIYW